MSMDPERKKAAFTNVLQALHVLDRNFGWVGGSDTDRAIGESIRRLSEVRDKANEHGYLPVASEKQCEDDKPDVANMVRLFILVRDGLQTDGAHHKQWFLQEIGKCVGLNPADIDHEEGIAP